MPFIIYPAIDLLGGQCVRLHKGDYDAVTTYGDPLVRVQAFHQAGARWLHLVDLGGAKDPAARQLPLIKEIVAATPLKVQTGGGIRTAQDVADLLEAGVERVVIGSLAVKQPDDVAALFQQYGGGRITLALDVLLNDDGVPMLAISGWREKTTIPLDDMIKRFMPEGLAHILCTDIGRDGTMTGPNEGLYVRLKESYPALHIQASGGVHHLDDLLSLQKQGIDGAIVGKAIYEGAVDLAAAVDRLKEAETC